MFERFTDRARRVVVLAQEEAKMLNHNYIGTEHILLGLIHEGEGVAAKALESLGISLDAVREQVQDIIGQGQQQPTGHIPFTPRAKKVLELSLREALQLGHNYIGTEHILLGLIREGEGVAAQVLVQLGADLNRVRQTVIQLLSGYQGGGQGGKETAGAGVGAVLLSPMRQRGSWTLAAVLMAALPVAAWFAGRVLLVEGNALLLQNTRQIGEFALTIRVHVMRALAVGLLLLAVRFFSRREDAAIPVILALAGCAAARLLPFLAVHDVWMDALPLCALAGVGVAKTAR